MGILVCSFFCSTCEVYSDRTGASDLPELVRVLYKNNISSFDLREHMPAHVDIPRMRRGRVGGFFWSVYVSCEVRGGLYWKVGKWLVSDYTCRTMARTFWCLRTVLGKVADMLRCKYLTQLCCLVRDTLEQIDVSKLLIQKHSDVGNPRYLAQTQRLLVPNRRSCWLQVRLISERHSEWAGSHLSSV
jgi:hypothetical protein